MISLSDHYGLEIDQGIEMMNDDKAYSGETDRKLPDFLSSWSNHVTSWQAMDKSARHILRYEDMLYKPEKTFSELAKFLGLKPPKERLKRAIKFSSFETSRKLEAEKGFNERSDKAEKFFRVGKAGQWKTALSPEQVEKIVAAHQDVMKEFKYLPPGYK